MTEHRPSETVLHCVGASFTLERDGSLWVQITSGSYAGVKLSDNDRRDLLAWLNRDENLIK